MDNALIMELLRSRDERALAELKRKYDKLCLCVAGNLLSQREDAEECVNSAYFDVWNNIPPDSPEDLKTYLCRIVKNKAIDKLKYNFAEKRNPTMAVSLDELAECLPADSDDSISARKLAGDISRFLKTQDEKYRKVFIRRYWYGDSLADISGHYGINEKTVATYLFRTRKKLREFLRKEGYEYE
ncbi:RNA polymerase sigma factor [Ruminococcus sp. XPD3002]|uniref:RNA polymerase sigma factor n=1 Tax=Ruminococcus sp. XPD3002 TaxID=1452269 RepID=UPI00091FAF4F|nr:RNA polymerase sigma factor [Ruminococcus sp.]SFX03613.1 RNA polymerase sigma-70 factor, ECF subfamily [Ruminococcus flavefaciens]